MDRVLDFFRNIGVYLKGLFVEDEGGFQEENLEVIPEVGPKDNPSPIAQAQVEDKAERSTLTNLSSLPQSKASEGTLSLPQKSPVNRHTEERETKTMNTSRPQNITDLHARQEELARQNSQGAPAEKHVIYVRYPRRYEETATFLDLLLQNESVLIDFQYMTEVQARRCLDYLYGARYVLSGDLRKVASGIYLLTPSNVVINIEDLQLAEETNNQAIEFDFDMKRR